MGSTNSLDPSTTRTTTIIAKPRHLTTRTVALTSQVTCLQSLQSYKSSLSVYNTNFTAPETPQLFDQTALTQTDRLSASALASDYYFEHSDSSLYNHPASTSSTA
ncbi:hypothetical protein KC19_9G024600 [Ceratodon purpureus]|uniref:Uncharacterized protein n=1 Tax=Ceratodon purpureus TaxID=3225 RepID=A0A8T0GRI7_CERPU|nr:hypothetical protein KC19_9G024600 [Ceratodon purpureus]